MTKIKNKNFEKLSQLDRIEYRQKEKECERFISIGDYGWYIIILISIFMIGGYINLAQIFSIILLYIIVIEILLFIINNLITKRKKQQLAEEYFKIVIKNKND